MEIEREADRSTDNGDPYEFEDEEYGEDAFALSCMPEQGESLWSCVTLTRERDLEWVTGGASVGGTTKGTASIVGGQ